MNTSTYNKLPFVEVKGKYAVYKGWVNIAEALKTHANKINKARLIIVVECYQGVVIEEIEQQLSNHLDTNETFLSTEVMYEEEVIKKMVYPDVTDDRIFGNLTDLNMHHFIDKNKVKAFCNEINKIGKGLILVIGPGASLVCPDYDLLVYADMARWEIQQRMRRHEVDNLGVKNRNTKDWMLLYKQGYFVDWRICDRLKKQLFDNIDFVLDTNKREEPKLVPNNAVLSGYKTAVKRPFSVVPFFDPGPWGGQWLKEVCNLDPNQDNYAWCFNCVPEENSLLLKIGGELIELPSINLVFRHPTELLGISVNERFGDEFPIRFDFLDTMGGGNLSLQVHPLTEYIKAKFGLRYTQDESYYMLDTKDGAFVYLGLKEDVEQESCIQDLKEARKGQKVFDDCKYIQTWPAKKHDHFLIPAGTIHCSGKNCMVLEISATPYIFTFKLWDWGRLGMDGKPRPINIEHAEQVVQWDRSTEWTKENLINRFEIVNQGKDWIEERTGLHELEFIETRRHWFTGLVKHETKFGVEVICLVEGEEIIVECPENNFEPYVIHYAEVFILPASIKKYTIRPFGKSLGKKCGTIKAYVRPQ